MIDMITNIIGVRALALIAAALLIACISLGVIVKLQDARLATVKAEKQTLTVQLHGVGDQIEAQNAAVNQLLANAAKAANDFQRALVAASHVRWVTKERIQYVTKAVIPVACPDAVTWGATHAIQIGRRWAAQPEQKDEP